MWLQIKSIQIYFCIGKQYSTVLLSVFNIEGRTIVGGGIVAVDQQFSISQKVRLLV